MKLKNTHTHTLEASDWVLVGLTPLQGYFIEGGRFVSLAPNFHHNHRRRHRLSLHVAVVVARTSTNDVKNTFQVVDSIANMNELRH